MKKVKAVKENPEPKKEWKWEVFYFVVLIIGLILGFFEIIIFRKTLINVYIPISIVVVTGFIGFYFSREHLKKVYSTSGNFILLVQNFGSWGFISCYLFMAANYYFANPVVKNYEAKIIEKSSMPGPKGSRSERQPLVRFKYFDFEKELVFKFKDREKVSSADSVKINIKKGALGFEVLESYDVF